MRRTRASFGTLWLLGGMVVGIIARYTLPPDWQPVAAVVLLGAIALAAVVRIALILRAPTARSSGAGRRR